MAEHRLIDGALKRTMDGIAARCECGWVSAGHFSSLAASAAFRDHQDTADQNAEDIRDRRAALNSW